MHNGRKGSMASFSFRLLMARMPVYLGYFKSALDRLTEMSIACNEIKEHYANAGNKMAEEFWEKREHVVVCSLINCALAVSTIAFAVFHRNANCFVCITDERFQFGRLFDGKTNGPAIVRYECTTSPLLSMGSYLFAMR